VAHLIPAACPDSFRGRTGAVVERVPRGFRFLLDRWFLRCDRSPGKQAASSMNASAYTRRVGFGDKGGRNLKEADYPEEGKVGIASWPLNRGLLTTALTTKGLYIGAKYNLWRID
jgi:hypothetical protein